MTGEATRQQGKKAAGSKKRHRLKTGATPAGAAPARIEVLPKRLPDLTGLLLPYQKRDIESRARFRWSNWSRQTGKSFSKSLRRILRGMERRKDQVFLSAGERQSKELMAKARMHLDAMKVASEYAEFEEVFEDVKVRVLQAHLPAFGMRILALPANPATARGYTADVMLDEFAMHKDSRAIWASVFPTVTRGEGEIDICSTPAGKSNMFYDLSLNEVFEHDTLTIHDAIAQGLDADAEILRKGISDPDLWRQEFLCEFIDENTAFLTYEMILACMDVKLPRELDIERLNAERGSDLFVGMDIGRVKDLTVIWVFAREGNTLISRGMIELRGMRFRGQFDVLSSVLRAPSVRRCCIDSTGIGAQLAEEAQDAFGAYRVEAVPFTPQVKEEMAGQLRVKFDDKNIRIPLADDIRNDLHSVQKSVTAAGNIRLFAPREDGSHADRFWAAALAVHAAGEASGPVQVEFGAPFDERVVTPTSLRCCPI